MTQASVLYVSMSVLPAASCELDVQSIVSHSRAKNDSLGITGALIFTGTYFAQHLEGPSDSVKRLMASIDADPRHDNVTVIDRQENTSRAFPEWSMAYNGPSLFVSRNVAKAFLTTSKSEHRKVAAWLRRLMVEFVRAS